MSKANPHRRRAAACRRSLTGASALAVALLAGCALRPPVFEPPPAGASRDAVFDARWSQYLASTRPEELQPDCRPRRIDPPPGVSYRGTIALLHGFSACPQQFFELAGLLAAQGYRVLLPLLPGHGRQFAAADGDDASGLPVTRDWQRRYEELAEYLNGTLTYAAGERVIGGLSVGGAASLFVSLQDRALYDRQIVMAPYFATAAGAPIDALVAGSGRTPAVRSVPVKMSGASSPCLSKRAEGRAGMCNYEIKHAAALDSLGRYNANALRAEPLAMPLQVVGVEGDSVISNPRLSEFLGWQSVTGKTSACFYPEGVPHAMISPYDNPGVDMYWLEALRTDIVSFVTTGRAFRTTGTPSQVAPWPLCRT